jgi:hypothetical protein
MVAIVIRTAKKEMQNLQGISKRKAKIVFLRRNLWALF